MNIAPAVLLVLAQQTAAAPATATEPRVYLTAVPLVAMQPEGEPFHRFSPPLSGRAFQLLLSTGGWVTPRLGVEGEVIFGGAISARQGFGYTWVEEYTAESRDVLASLLVRWRPGGNILHVVGGAGIARSTIGKKDILTTYWASPGRPSERSPGWQQTAVGMLFSAGFDFDVPVNRRVAIVPTFRVRSIGRSSLEYATYMGIAGVRLDLGVGVRAKF